MITADAIAAAADYLEPEERVRLQRLIDEIKLPPMPLHTFVREFWHVVEPGTDFIDNWHIAAICEHLEAQLWGDIPNLIINIQPRHMKSLLVAGFWQPWTWTFRPSSRWLFYSYKEKLSTRDNVKARNIMKSPKYREMFGDVFKFAGDQNLKTRYENTKGGFREATGVGGSTGEGGDHLVADDLLAIDDRFSEPKRERANDFWETTAASRRNHEYATRTIICQRLHEFDIVGYLSDKEKEGGDHYELLVLPTEYEGNKYVTSIGWQDPRKERGDLLWPDRFPAKTIASLKRTLGVAQATAQLQQRPTPAGGNIFKLKYWKIWIPAGVSLPPVRYKNEAGETAYFPQVELPKAFDLIAQSWDLAFKDTAGSSRVAGQTWGKAASNVYLLDAVAEEMDIVRTIKELKMMIARNPQTGAVWVEDKANGPAIIQLMSDEIPGLIAVSPQGSKEARANAAVPFAESGNIYLPHPAIAEWIWRYIDELAKFPLHAYDDQVDATTQALIRLFLTPSTAKKAGTW